MADLEPYQQRVVEERDELAPRVDRLHNFVNGASFESATVVEQGFLKAQLGYMQGYLNSLNSRIKLWK